MDVVVAITSVITFVFNSKFFSITPLLSCISIFYTRLKNLWRKVFDFGFPRQLAGIGA